MHLFNNELKTDFLNMYIIQLVFEKIYFQYLFRLALIKRKQMYFYTFQKCIFTQINTHVPILIIFKIENV